MKNIVFSFALVLLAAVSAQAQSLGQPQTQTLRTHAQADYIRNERVQLEKETELKILEKLEESRLQEERTRMQRIEATNFSVVNPTAQSQQQVPVQVQTQTF
ncbi:hypothetical protein [Bdellovibrio svalbardensis]|uniref:Uncharacterized protein n=1 Tax=Bdellovibrio svalbardensis TaxID=2972972 RepID=A0ABT6DKV8_9BACT|nr:hypothetical protein [Bdellovibrio svalbardensis]MDG0816544.1 hypothetical protein [Bdellovibrio svalbardensis]